jgi:hypothetical protein
MGDERIRPEPDVDHDRKDPSWGWLVACLIVLQLVLFTVAVAVGGIMVARLDGAVKRLDVQAQRIDAVALGQCARVQVERERSNVAEATLWIVLDAAAITAPTAEVRRVYREQADVAAWSPPANCPLAVKEPRTYRLPKVVPYRLLPRSYPHRIVAAAKRGRPQPLP